MKQTAVEWFFNELYSIRKTIEFELQADAILKAFKQALEMEKQQIEKAYNQGWLQCNIEDLPERSRKRFYDSEEYYKENFKK